MENTIIIYSRASTQKSDSDTTENQLTELRRWATENSYRVVGEFKDLASGKSMEARKGLKQALKIAQMLECPIACVELSRLSRSVADTANLIDSNQEFIFTRAGRAMSKEMVLFASLLGQMESEAISRRVSAGIQNLFKENPEARKTWGGGSRPAAAVKAMNGARIKKADSFALQYGEMILTLRDNGMTLKNVCEMLHRMEIRTARGSLKWNPSQVRNLILRYQNLTAPTHS